LTANFSSSSILQLFEIKHNYLMNKIQDRPLSVPM
jgi:hypothetical protein